jgi:2-amino-4-hydroxy-6-hydroxymethyldihydropteridine diphosphokinase
MPATETSRSATAFIGLGSNLDEPERQLCSALDRLSRAEAVSLVRTSGFYRSAPWGRTDQPGFINAVAVVRTSRAPGELLNILLGIEREMGRDRAVGRWGPRCIDLDLLTYNGQRISSPDLELPHPRMHLRTFVLRPLLELEPGFVIPGIGPAADLPASREDRDVQWLGTAESFCDRMKNE